VARGLVDVDVDRGHEVEAAQGAVEPGAVRGREHRVAGDGQHRPDLALAGGLDLLAQRRDRQLAGGLGQVAHPGAPRVVVAAADQPRAHRVDRRRGEHRTARPVEVAAEDVEAVHRPLADRAPRPGRDADPAVDDARVGGQELVGEAAYDVGRQPAHRLGALRCEVRDQPDHRVDPVDVRRRRRRGLGREDVQHRQQYPRIRAGPHEVVLVGDLRGLGAARVQDDHPPAARLELAHALGEVGHRHQAAVEELVAEDEVRDELVGELVDRGGRVAVLRAEGLEHRGAVRHRPQAVGVGVAEVDAQRVVAVLVDDARQVVGDQVVRLVPADLLPAGVGSLADAAHRAPQPVRVGVHVGDRDALRADVAARQGIGRVAAHPDDLAALDGQLEATDRLAQVAHADPLLRCHGAIVARGTPQGGDTQRLAGQTLPRPVQTGQHPPNRMEHVMGFGGPIGLIVVGLILAFALNDQQVGPLNMWTLGIILALAGVLWLVLTMVQQNTKRRHTTTATTTDAHGRQATTQRTDESDPPPPPAV
jgi:hypothetical protein